MTDIAIQFDNTTGYGHWSYADGDVTTTNGLQDLENAVALCLFTDRRCADIVMPPDGDRKGWWADSYFDTPLGSQLWLLDRAKKVGNAQLLLQARDYCKEALQWLIDDGIVDTVKVQTSWINATAIGIQITVSEPQQLATKTFSYSWAWKG